VRLPPTACFGAALFLCACVPSSETVHFRLQGSITAAPHLQKKVEQPDAVLLIVAMNAGGVPVAVKRILHPKLPLEYQLAEEDLVLPGPIRGPFTLKVHVSTHGQAGISVHGDMMGTHSGPVGANDRNVNVVIDKEV
jgi:hypothetical protein